MINRSKIVNKYKEFSGKDYSRFIVDEFVKIVESNLGIEQELDINVKARKLIDSTVDALDISASKKVFRIPTVWEGKKWYSKEIEELATKRDEAYRKALYDSMEHNWQQFKIKRNAVVKLIRTKKKEYYERMIDYNSSNPTCGNHCRKLLEEAQ